jgi:hypothetical protein
MVHVASAMIFTRRICRPVVENFKEKINTMKKIASIAIGLGLILGLTTATFAADKTTKAKSTAKKSTKAAKKSTAKM